VLLIFEILIYCMNLGFMRTESRQVPIWIVLKFNCLYNALHSSIVQIIKLLGPIACRMSGCRVSGSGRGHH